MRYLLILVILMLMFPCQNLYPRLLINEITTSSVVDWVELTYTNFDKEEMDVSGLYVTMYYGSNEPMGSGNDTITICSYDKPDTSYDDRFIVVHLTEPDRADETDSTGDLNKNGYLDVYCNNYYNSLWNSDGIVAIDSDDDPSNGGIVDFIAYSNMDGSPNGTIKSYIEEAQNREHWQKHTGENIQECMVDIGLDGLTSTMSISRKNLSDTNSLSDFAVTRFQTPGRENIFTIRNKKRRLFKALKKRVSIAPGATSLRPCSIPLFIYDNCNMRFRVFSITGVKLFESHLFRSIPPGNHSIYWDPRNQLNKLRGHSSVTTGLYIGLLEATGVNEQVSQRETIFLILSRYK
ncbi:hypothetical protein ACFL20_08120 [Spirochaetota bacterium]